MLSSITPLGERGRGQRWEITMGFFVLGSTAGGSALGGLLGAAGGVAGLGTRPVALWLLAAAALLGAAFDGRLPTTRRQVNEDWLGRYRGWVYGGAFGAQLGAGVVTVVTTSAVYVTFAAAFLSGSAVLGAVVGGCFGLVRALPVVATRRVRRTDQLVAVDRRLDAWNRPARGLAVAAQVAIGVTVAGLAMAVAR